MSRIYNIRWKESDHQELSKAVKNFNAKISRIIKKDPSMKNVLPEKVGIGQMRELIETRADLNREINALKRFTQRGSEELVEVPDNEYNLKITKWQKEEMTRRIGIINKKRNKRLKDLQETELTSRGEDLGYTKGELGMGKAEAVSLSPMKAFSPKMGRSDLKVKFRNIMKESQSTYWNKRDILLKDNYIKSLEENFNTENIKDIIQAIQDMDYKEFKQKFDAEGGNFELSYPMGNIETEMEYISALRAIWLPNN